ncbi:non-SMC mitotic condensation complex subunit 1-domain-containing protein [Hysterangium stoloniferum]|nr:non-SMC mitotic condensation complex subunit 1-domain-containing protein [Hysterangium stoloniferum]
MTFNLQEECQTLQQDISNYTIPNDHDVRNMDQAAVVDLLDGAIEATAQSSDAITQVEIFDVYRSLLKGIDALNSATISKLLDSISSGLLGEVDAAQRTLDTPDADSTALSEHKRPLEYYAFLLQWFVLAADKVVQARGPPSPSSKPKRGAKGKAGGKKKGGTIADVVGPWTWESQIPVTLALISKVLRLKTHRLWTTSAERDAFINCVTRPAYIITESEAYMKNNEVRLGVYKIICLAVKHHGHGFGAQISIMQCLQYFEHLSEPMAEALTVLAKEFDHSQLAEEILREIAGKQFNAQDTKGPRSFSRFLIRFAELSPRILLKQISLLLCHLDSESYPMRMALVEVIGMLIREIAMSDEGEQESREKKINNLFELLTERFLDLSSYVRAKVINTLSRLCDLPVKFPKQRLVSTELTIGALEDKASSVRRYAIALLTKLILTHPYGLMHGGLLRIEEWETRYKAVSAELEQVETKEMERPPVEKEGEGDEDETEDSDEEEDDDGAAETDESDSTNMQSSPVKSTPARTPKTLKRQAITSSCSRDLSRSKSIATPGLGEITEGEEMDIDEDDDDDEGFDERMDDLLDVAMEDSKESFDEFSEHDDMDETPSKQSVRSSRARSSSVVATAKIASTPARRSGVPKTPRTVKPSGKKPKKKKKKAHQSEALDLSALTNEQAALAALESNHILHLRLRKRYYAEGLNFIRQIEGAMEILGQLLGSKNKPEVLEAMEFFRVAYEYQFLSAELGIKKMLHLIWTKDNSSTTEDGNELKGVRSRLIECYRSLYFDPLPDMEPKQQVNRIAKNMIQLTYDATLAELTSLEELVRTMIDDDQIHSDVVSKLWHVYSSDRQLPKNQRRGAIIILGMLAVAKRHIVSERIEVLLKVGLGPLGKADLILARYTCIALQRLNGSVKNVKGSLLDKSVRLPMDSPIFRKLQDMIEHPCRSKDWFGMAEQAINTIYLLGEHPDQLCNDLIKNLTRRAFDRQPSSIVKRDPDAMEEDINQADRSGTASATSQATDISTDMGDSFLLSQLVFVVGHVAIKHIVFLEFVEKEWKRQKEEKEKEEKTKRKATGATKPLSKDGEELDQVAGNAEDEIGERIAAVRETELLYGAESLLAIFGGMIVHICGSPHKFKSQILRTTATLSFSKFLCVSSQFCDQHHRLLFKILETSSDPNIRSNIVIALGDVAVSFSNIFDENSDELYKGLSDRDLIVKKNTLMVLTHLILNGMIKVKGQLGEMAKCLEDTDTRIADLAKLFFTELSTKDNAIYNNLPDVISHLSVGEHAVDEETFQSTMKYIFSFIEKEKQAENIVEKLCQRFRLAEDPRQWRDIAFCLSLLPFKSERSMKKLIEGLPFYQDKLHEETVFNRFNDLLVKARTNRSANKPDSELKEFETILTEHKQQGEEDQALEKRVEGKRAAAKKRATRRN